MLNGKAKNKVIPIKRRSKIQNCTEINKLYQIKIYDTYHITKVLLLVKKTCIRKEVIFTIRIINLACVTTLHGEWAQCICCSDSLTSHRDTTE